jgi:hypothetical protein
VTRPRLAVVDIRLLVLSHAGERLHYRGAIRGRTGCGRMIDRPATEEDGLLHPCRRCWRDDPPEIRRRPAR